MSNNSTSHTNFRKLACHAKARFASLPHFDPAMFNTSMAVDWHALAKRTARLVDAVNKAEWVNVECPNGTAMHICKKGAGLKGMTVCSPLKGLLATCLPVRPIWRHWKGRATV